MSLLDNVRVASPCQADWNQMPGDERVRHCPECNLNVYNFSALNAVEAENVLRTTEGRLCAKLLRRRDGTILTADCPMGQRQIRRQLPRLIAAMLALVGCSSCVSQSLGALDVHRRAVDGNHDGSAGKGTAIKTNKRQPVPTPTAEVGQ